MPPNDNDIWKALMWISHQVHCVEKKVMFLIEQSKPDYSKEDKILRQMTKKLGEARGRLPHDEKPKKKGK